MGLGTRGTNPDDAAWSAALKHRPRYARPLGEYFATYGVRERGLKKWLEDARTRWIAVGCPSGGPEFPPLDDPPKMLAWWLAHKSHAPSAELLALAGESAAAVMATAAPASPATPSSSPPAAAGSPAPASGAKRTAIDVDALSPIDLAGAARQQRKILAAALQEHTAAMADPHATDATISLRAKRVDDAMERLRTIDAALIKSQRETGELVHRDAVRDDCAPIFSAMADSLVSEVVEAFGVPRAQATAFADKWFSLLRESRFFSVVAPALAPAAAAA